MCDQIWKQSQHLKLFVKFLKPFLYIFLEGGRAIEEVPFKKRWGHQLKTADHFFFVINCLSTGKHMNHLNRYSHQNAIGRLGMLSSFFKRHQICNLLSFLCSKRTHGNICQRLWHFLTWIKNIMNKVSICTINNFSIKSYSPMQQLNAASWHLLNHL